MKTATPRLVLVLGVLLAINTLNFYDRQVLGAVAEPVRRELDLDDARYGWLTPAFLLLYAVIGIPLGRLADRGRRTHILAGGVLLWSVMTALSALAWSFWSMFAFRLGVGVGEAACAPAANSLLGDLFPRERRARALAVFMLGLPLGLALSSAVSGIVADRWGWRSAFLVAGLPGLALGLVCLLIPEPDRGVAETHFVGSERRRGSPLLLVLSIPTMWWLILSGALHNFNMYALGAFLTPFLQRYHSLTIRQAGWLSSAVYVCGGAGIFLGGWACDWAVRRRVSGRLEVTTLASAAAAASIYLALRPAPGQVGAFAAWMLPGCLFLYVYYSGVYATIQDVIEPALRGTALALYFGVMYLFAAFGPVVVGSLSKDLAARAAAAEGSAVITDWHRAVALHEALRLVPLLGVLLVVVLFLASRTVTEDAQRLQKWMQSQGKGEQASDPGAGPSGTDLAAGNRPEEDGR
jgi:MFS family permease